MPDTLTEDFETYNKGLPSIGYNPTINTAETTRTFFERVQDNHKDLREYIGGVRRSSLIKLNNVQKPANQGEINKLVLELCRDYPYVTEELRYGFGVTRDSYNYPTHQHGSHRFIKLTKAILEQYRRSYSPDIPTKLNKLLENFGNIWKNAQVEEKEVEVTLATSAIGFLKLGYYGVDMDSCFRTGAGNSYNKTILAQSHNTYIILIKDTGIDQKVLARAWGFVDKDFSIWNVSNIYSSGIQHGTIVEALRIFFDDLAEEPHNIHEDKLRIAHGFIYLNPTGQYSFAPKDIKRMQFQVLYPVITNVRSIDKCITCGETEQVCYLGGYGCKNCIPKQYKYYCQYWDWYTNENVVPCIDASGEEINVSQRYAFEPLHFITCNLCSKRYATQLITHHKGTNYCPKCYELVEESKIKSKITKKVRTKKRDYDESVA